MNRKGLDVYPWVKVDLFDFYGNQICLVCQKGAENVRVRWKGGTKQVTS